MGIRRRSNGSLVGRSVGWVEDDEALAVLVDDEHDEEHSARESVSAKNNRDGELKLAPSGVGCSKGEKKQSREEEE